LLRTEKAEGERLEDEESGRGWRNLYVVFTNLR
jgi:hypothetical protein